MIVLRDSGGAGVRLRDRDVRVDTFRATGPGGQHRNKTDSAVRMTHLPTGLTATATESRSQHQNRRVARERLLQGLTQRQQSQSQARSNQSRQSGLEGERAWVWTGWRNQVKGPTGQRAPMDRALAGDLRGLLAHAKGVL